jgi:hypothetical protein
MTTQFRSLGFITEREQNWVLLKLGMKQLAGSAGSNYGQKDIRVALRMIL